MKFTRIAAIAAEYLGEPLHHEKTHLPFCLGDFFP